MGEGPRREARFGTGAVVNGKDQRTIRINANLMPEAQILRFYELHIHI